MKTGVDNGDNYAIFLFLNIVILLAPEKLLPNCLTI
jgi:hypothetical protein